MARATDEERDYFARIARQNATLPEEGIPASLAEMFDRLEEIRRIHGPLANPGLDGSDEGDLRAHLAFLERRDELRRRGTNGA